MPINNQRIEAYKYIQERLSKLSVSYNESYRELHIPLDELMDLQAGIADPSESLIAALKHY